MGMGIKIQASGMKRTWNIVVFAYLVLLIWAINFNPMLLVEFRVIVTILLMVGIVERAVAVIQLASGGEPICTGCGQPEYQCSGSSNCIK